MLPLEAASEVTLGGAVVCLALPPGLPEAADPTCAEGCTAQPLWTWVQHQVFFKTVQFVAQSE